MLGNCSFNGIPLLLVKGEIIIPSYISCFNPTQYREHNMISPRSSVTGLTMLQTTGLFELPVKDFDLQAFPYQGFNLLPGGTLYICPNVIRASVARHKPEDSYPTIPSKMN